MLGFLSFTLLPWMKRIEQSINRRLLRPDQRRRLHATFNPEALLRAASAARAAFYSSMTQNGIYTRDDCRIKENLAPMGGNAAKLTVQSNMLPIDKLGGAVLPKNRQRSALRFQIGDGFQKCARSDDLVIAVDHAEHGTVARKKAVIADSLHVIVE